MDDQYASVILSTTLCTPGVLQAEFVADSRSAHVCTVPDSVTSLPCTAAKMSFASAIAVRFIAASMSDLTWMHPSWKCFGAFSLGLLLLLDRAA